MKGNHLKDRLARYRQIKISVIGRKSGRTISVICRFTLSVSSGLDVRRCLFCANSYSDIPWTELTVCFT
jgi:hypothetical protein